MIQNLVVTRGQSFSEDFNLKRPDGKSTSGRGYQFLVIVYRKNFVREYPLQNLGNKLRFNLTPEQISDFDSNALSYKIVVDNSTREVISQGVLRIQ